MKVYLGFGANLGRREVAIWRAIDRLRVCLHGVQLSPFYETSPVGQANQSDFLNLALQGEWEGSPQELFMWAKQIERDLGRQKRERFGPREIDINVLAIDGVMTTAPELTVPHPRLSERRFALRPLADLAPGLVLDPNGTTVRQALANLSSDDRCELFLPTATLADLSPWWMRQALEHMSAFILKDVFPPELARQLTYTAREALRRPEAAKGLYLKMNPRGSGYTPPGIERVSRYGTDTFQDFWDVLAPRRGENLLLADAPGFSEAVLISFGILEALAMMCFTYLDAACETTIATDAQDGEHMLRCSRYLTGSDPGRVLFPEHYDFGLLTLFGGGVAPGLEAEYGGAWHALHRFMRAGNILVGAGNVLKLYMPALSRAFHHRVTAANTEEDERLSYSLFTEPRADVRLPNGELAGDRLRRLVERIRGAPAA